MALGNVTLRDTLTARAGGSIKAVCSLSLLLFTVSLIVCD